MALPLPNRLLTRCGTAVIILASGIWFYWLCQNRLIARDEGFYTFAAALLLEKSLYTDFFFPQGPTSVAFLALLFSFTGASWEAARGLSAFFSVVLVTGLWLYWLRLSGWQIALFATVALATTNNFFAWMPTAQSYPFAALFSVASCVLVQQRLRSHSTLLCFVAGMLLGLGALSRLYMICLALPSVLCLMVYQEQALKKTTCYLAGALVLPLLLFISYRSQIDVLWFNLAGYHLLRSSKSFVDSLEQKQIVAAVIVGLKPTIKFEVNQMALLFWTCGILSLLRIIFRGSLSTWLIFIATLSVVSLVPDPPYVQYFCLLVPFLMLAIADDLTTLVYGGRLQLAAPVLLLGLVSTLIYFNRGLAEDVRRYTHSGDGVIGIYNRENARVWNLQHIRRVARLAEQSFPPGPVYSFWPGFLLETSHPSAAGYENHFARRITDFVSPEQRKRFHLPQPGALEQQISTRSLSGLILDSPLTPAQIAAGYARVPGTNIPLLYASTSGDPEKSAGTGK